MYENIPISSVSRISMTLMFAKGNISSLAKILFFLLFGEEFYQG